MLTCGAAVIEGIDMGDHEHRADRRGGRRRPGPVCPAGPSCSAVAVDGLTRPDTAVPAVLASAVLGPAVLAPVR